MFEVEFLILEGKNGRTNRKNGIKGKKTKRHMALTREHITSKDRLSILLILLFRVTKRSNITH